MEKRRVMTHEEYERILKRIYILFSSRSITINKKDILQEPDKQNDNSNKDYQAYKPTE